MSRDDYPPVVKHGEPPIERGWMDLQYAPKDGTEILLLVRHQNWRVAPPEDRHRWEAVVVANWTDHNRGGWTWTGLAGIPVGWRPLE